MNSLWSFRSIKNQEFTPPRRMIVSNTKVTCLLQAGAEIAFSGKHYIVTNP